MGLYEFDDKNFENEVLASSTPVLVDFSAEWCGPCKQLAPVIEELANDFEGRVKVGKLDVDESQKTAMRYGVMGVPTVILFENGEPVDQAVGRVSKSVLESKITKLLD